MQHVVRNLIQGGAAGFLAGGLVGLVEAAYLAPGAPDRLAPVYALVLYALLGLPIGLGASILVSAVGLKAKVPEKWAFTVPMAATFSAMGLVILRYVLNRDLYMEQGVPLSGLAGIAAVLLVADAVVATASVGPVVAGLRAARAAKVAVAANLRRSLLYNAVAVTAAVLGYVNPLVAAISMPLSSAMVIVGALAVERRVKRQERRSPEAAPQPSTSASAA